MPLLLSRPLPVQVFAAVILPAAFGLLTGYLLGVSAAGYWLTQVVGILGGLVAGYDHLGSDQGFVRGLCGGLLFGTFILVGHSVFHDTAKVTLPHPHGVLVGFTTLAGGILGAIGGGRRAKREQKVAGAAA